MQKYTQFYLDVGTRKIADFVDPKVLSDNELEFPMDSMLFWNNIQEIITAPSREYGYLKNLKLPVVVTPTDYEIETIGKFKKRTDINVNRLIQKFKSDAKGFKFLKPNTKNISVSNKKLLIFNYGVINPIHKYSQHPMNNYYKWYNAFGTVCKTLRSDMTGSNKNKFLLIKIPFVIPERKIFEKYAAKLDRRGLEYFNTNSHLDLLDIWRLLTPELRETSLLNQIPEEEMNDVTLLFSLNSKVVIVNLGILMSIVKDYDIKSKLTKYNAFTVRKLFYLFLTKVIATIPKHLDEIINTKENTLPVDNITDLTDLVDDPVDDKNIEESIDEEVVENLNTNELEDTLEDNIDIVAKDNKEKLKHKVNKLKEEKLISKKQIEKIETVLENQSKKILKLPNGKKGTLIELTKYSKEDFTVDTSLNTIPQDSIVKDKDQLVDTVGIIEKKYINQVMHKDILNVITGIEGNNFIVEDIDITENTNIMGSTLEYTISILGLDGKPHKLNFTLPKVEEDGTFVLSKNKYYLRKQKSDLPIRKISNTEVALTSYYGKLFITKANFKKDDVGFWIKKQLLKQYQEENTNLKDLVFIPVKVTDVKLPKLYGKIIRYTKSFTKGKYEFNFDYPNRYKILKLKNVTDLKDVENNDMVIIGKNGKNAILMDQDDKLWLHKDNSYVELPSLFELLELGTSTMPIEHASMKIYSKTFPIVAILGYYYGLEKLLKVTKAEYVKEEVNKRVPVNNDEYVIKFSDYKLIIKKDGGVNDLLFSGYLSIQKYIKQMSLKHMNNKNTYLALFNMMELPVSYINEIKILLNMYIDPITKTLLEELKEPTLFTKLLLRAVELLTDDNYVNPNDIRNTVIKGYERISGMLYNELVKSVRDYENRSVFGKAKLNMKPYSIIAKLNEDSTTVLVDDLNPMAELKQHDDVGNLGFGGRSKVTMNRDTRVLHPSEIGIVSEATRDSSDVGISMFLTANPKIESVRGIVGQYDSKKDSQARTMSAVALLSPAANKDDPKRSNFANIMASHVIPIDGAKVSPVRTGYEAVVPFRMSDKYIVHAKEDGKVLEVTKSYLKVQYKTETVKYPIKKWTTKEESGATYSHKLITSLKKGNKFKKFDTLLYDPAFFEEDIFQPGRSVYKTSVNINVALMEDPNTFEDSSSISKKTSKLLTTTVTKVKSIVVNNTDIVLDMVKEGDKLEPNTVLFSISDASVYKLKGLDKETLEALKRLKQASPKSKYKGIVNKIEIYYNSPFEELSDELQELAKQSDKELQRNLGKKDITGQVTSGYSIQGKPLLEGQVEIKIYIDTKESMGVADKLIFANQLKSTVSEVYDYTMSAEDGTEIDALFGFKSISARIVNSPYIIGTTSKVLEVLSEKAVETYFGKE